VNRGEAEQDIADIRDNRASVFCPTIIGSCRADCECYTEHLWKVEDGDYDYFAGCTNYSIVGPMN